jgi:DNA repair protein RecO
MHHVHIVQGLVLGKRSAGENNTLVLLLTREHGLVRAHARSARLERSKLRYGLEPLTLARYCMVQGRFEWKLTGVEQVQRPLLIAALGSRRRAGKISRLLLRLIQGQEPTPGLFESVTEGLASLAKVMSEDEADALECVLVLRVLSHLGYLPARPELEPFLAHSPYSAELSQVARESRVALIRAINESLGATGL